MLLKMNIVSRGGSLLFAWMMMTGNENPFFEYYDEVLEILREYDVTISLGDALRPGCLADASDAAQISELIELGNLTKRAWLHDIAVRRLKISRIPRIRNIAAGTGEGKKFVNLSIRIILQHPVQIAEIRGIHADDVVGALVILPCNLLRVMRQG